jgi:hypothetical protein
MRQRITSLLRIDANATFPLWLKLIALAYLSVFIPFWWKNYGLKNFLWFSCLGVILTVVALWMENRLLASMMLLSTFMADEIGWGGDFLFRLFFGWHPFGATAYMFDESLSLPSRALSLYHFVVPLLLVWMVYKLRYDRRALARQSLFSTIILLFSFTLTNPVNNINWVFGFGTQPQKYVPEWLYLLAEIITIPLAFYLPVHLLVCKLGWHMPKLSREASKD